MRRRSSPPAPGEVTTDPHTGQGASVGALPSKPGPLVRETSPPPPPPPAATAARAAAALVSGLPQSEQNCAPASFCRPQNWQALRAIRLGGPIYCSTLACATCEPFAPRSPRSSSSRRGARPTESPPHLSSPPTHCTSTSSLPTTPRHITRRIRPSSLAEC